MSDFYLLDTHVLYWTQQDPDRLSPKARKALQQGSIVVSVASYWEVTIKSGKGMWPVKTPLIWWEKAVELTGADILPIRVNHVSALHDLPHHHKDPFDRILAAQAIAEGYSLVTGDSILQKYPVKTIW